jgi:sugar lactone lactonase YvrE
MTKNTKNLQGAGHSDGVTVALRGHALILLGAVLAFVLCLPAAAQAATATSSYAVGSQFGILSDEGTQGYSSVAVGQSTGNIFVSNHNDFWARVFAPDPGSGGTPLAVADFNSLGFDPLNLAVDPENGAVYANDNSLYGTGFAKAISDGAPTPTYTIDLSFAVVPGLISSPRGMAVDPVSHDLLVVDGASNRVYRLASSTGALISSFDGSDTTAGAFASPGAVAVGPTGTIYVVDTAGDRVEQFSAAGTSTGALSLPAGAHPSGLAVNPQNGNVAVLIALGDQTYLQGFASSGTQTFRARVTAGVAAPANGLAWDGGTNRIYASVGVGFVRTLVPATQPGVDPAVATPGRNTVHLTTDIDPGGEDTTARFEYCPATAACDSYLLSNPSDPANPWQRGPDHANLTSAGPLVDDLVLSSNTSWRVRVFAVNTATGTDITSPVVDFDSPLLTPGVTTGNAGSITGSQAVLTGMIDTLGGQATYHFEYGLTSNYGSRIPAVQEAPAGNNRTPRTVTKTVTGLQSGTTYHYRLVAKNSAGEAAGIDRTFTAIGPDEVAPQRAYEQVTTGKNGAQLNSTRRVQAAPDGSAIAVNAVASPDDADTTLLAQSFLSRRGAQDWLQWRQVDAPQSAAPGLMEASTAAVSPDFEHALVASNRILAPGGIAGGGNLYIKDLRTEAYTFVASAPGVDAYRLLVNVGAPQVVYMGGASDFSWVLFWGQTSFLSETMGYPAIYRWSRTGGLSIESRLPDHSVPPSAVQVPGGSQLTFPSSSTDGGVVAFANGGVYRRANGQTTAVSVSRIAGDPPGPMPGFFDALTPDGRYVFFHSSAPLTDDTPSLVGGHVPAYRYDAVTHDLRFVGLVGAANPYEFYGASDDGQIAYFDGGDGVGTNVWHDGVVRNVTASKPNVDSQEVYVTANGRYFAWLSADDLQVHRYDEQTDRSVCVSCLADGGPANGVQLLYGARELSNRAPRAVTETGEVFFDTTSPLVTADHNGTKDVYAYTNRPTLISPGDGPFDALFADASDDGSSVFFQTDEGIVSRDTDESPDVYVARVGGGFPGQSPPAPRAPCVRAECGELGGGPVVSSPVSSSSTGESGGSARTNQEKVVLSLSKVSFGSKSVRVTFRASERGRVRVTGSRVVTTVRNVAKAGSYSVSVRLGKKARGLVRAHKKLKVSLKVSLSGGWGSASAKYSRTLGN